MDEWLKHPSLLPNGSATFGQAKDKERTNCKTNGQPDSTSKASKGRIAIIEEMRDYY